MKPLEKRIVRLEKQWLPEKRKGPRIVTYEEFKFIYSLPKAFPDPNTMPKFMQQRYFGNCDRPSPKWEWSAEEVQFANTLHDRNHY